MKEICKKPISETERILSQSDIESDKMLADITAHNHISYVSTMPSLDGILRLERGTLGYFACSFYDLATHSLIAFDDDEVVYGYEGEQKRTEELRAQRLFQAQK